MTLALTLSIVFAILACFFAYGGARTIIKQEAGAPFLFVGSVILLYCAVFLMFTAFQ